MSNEKIKTHDTEANSHGTLCLDIWDSLRFLNATPPDSDPTKFEDCCSEVSRFMANEVEIKLIPDFYSCITLGTLRW